MSKFSQRNYPAPRDMTTVTVPVPQPARAEQTVAKPAVTMPPTDAPNPSYLTPKPEAPPPAPSVRVLADRVEFLAPKIKLVEHVFVGNTQTDKLEPKRAYVAHGVLVIEEFGLALHGASFRVTF